MNESRAGFIERWMPRTIASRLYLILSVGLLLAYGLSFGLLFYERYVAAMSLMLDTLERDIATSVAVLDRLPAAERGDWLARLQRGNYRYILGPGDTDGPTGRAQPASARQLCGIALGVA